MWDWERYLDLARDLAYDPNADESDYRCAASRAYYAAFHKARIWIDRNDQSVQLTRGAEDHTRVWNGFERRRDRNSTKIAQTGKRLKELRRKADYDSIVNDPQGKAVDAVEDASSILELLRTH